jgi:hypothetical protein
VASVRESTVLSGARLQDAQAEAGRVKFTIVAGIKEAR